MTILGELPISDGNRSIHGRVGYASQQAWIFNGTVKDNILFGQDFDEDRYLEVIDACALQKVRYGFTHGMAIINLYFFVCSAGLSLSCKPK